MKDEILEELWKSKDEVAEEYSYNIDKLVEDLRKKERCVKATVIDLTFENKRQKQMSSLDIKL